MEVLIPVASIIGGILLVIVMVWQNGRIRELAMRERIALIEKGLVPSPEVDPAGFEALLGRASRRSSRATERASRYRSSGIIITGIGIALMLIIAFAGDAPRAAMGVGGAVVAIGLACVLNSWFELNAQPAPSPSGLAGFDPPPPPPPAPRGGSQANVL